jgi:O-antigen ligase
MPATVVKAFDHRRLLQVADCLAVGVAVSLPWSTSATGIFIALWLVAVLPTMNVDLVWRTVKTPAGGLPVLLWLIAALGMLWADVTWSERFGGLDGFNKLLVVPLLLAQFRRSEQGALVLYGFLISATCLLLTSWLFATIPALESHGKFYGVPVKDYIYQTDEFLICGFALLGISGEVGAGHKRRSDLMLLALAAIFLVNIAFVFSSRTGMLIAPFLIAILGWRLADVKGVAVACLITMVLAPLLWLTSPHLHNFALASINDMRGYYTTDAVTSSGLHLEFLRKSVEIVKAAPLIGHGTGSIAEEFRRTAVGESGAAAAVSVNPHNQIFAVAIQLGLIGAVVLAVMWAAHFMLFCRPGLMAWSGMVVVVENMLSSTVNSHLFDFSQGWLYVFGVGVAGGMMLRTADAELGKAGAGSSLLSSAAKYL